MRENRKSGLMSGEGKRSDADTAQTTTPLLDSTKQLLKNVCRFYFLSFKRISNNFIFIKHIITTIAVNQKGPPTKKLYPIRKKSMYMIPNKILATTNYTPVIIYHIIIKY
ncbi:MAG TPA: hypothetical protein QF556_05705, partial [Rhodospirillales bacterium]|nr:hypothetical protein [Rhodospirillales bacterium]